jgi:hypothetical protein
MRIARFGGGGRVPAAALFTLTLLTACGEFTFDGNTPPPATWKWTDLGGPAAATPRYVANHETLVILGTELLLGTDDGIWRRPLSGEHPWQRAGLTGRAIHALTLTSDGQRLIAAGFDPRNQAAVTAWYSTDAGTNWINAATWPRSQPGSPEGNIAYPFHALEADPLDANVVYGNLDGDTLAVTVDGGSSWIMTNGATSPTFGYHCVPFRPADVSVILQGCELPLDVAWVGARRVIKADRFELPDFRFVYGFPDTAELGNRRINGIAAVPGSKNRVFVGVEGGLVELKSKSGNWTNRADLEANWLFFAEHGSNKPYAYIRAIAPLDTSGDNVLFGGPLNGDNKEILLFETADRGKTVRQVKAPFSLRDPRLEQAVRINGNDVLVVVGQVPTGVPVDAPGAHRPKVYRLRRS